MISMKRRTTLVPGKPLESMKDTAPAPAFRWPFLPSVLREASFQCPQPAGCRSQLDSNRTTGFRLRFLTNFCKVERLQVYSLILHLSFGFLNPA